MRVVFVLLSLFLLNCITAGQTKQWFRNFVELGERKVSKSELERFLGSVPAEIDDVPGAWGKGATYDISFGTVRVLYSKGRCSLNDKLSWDIEDDIVMSVEFILKEPSPFKKTGLASLKLDKFREDDNFNYHFVDRKRGRDFTIFDGKLKRISFAYSHIEPRRCRDVASGNPLPGL